MSYVLPQFFLTGFRSFSLQGNPVCSAVLHMTAAGSNLVINITNEKKEGKKARPVFLAQLNTESLFFILFLLLFLSHTSIIVG